MLAARFSCHDHTKVAGFYCSPLMCARTIRASGRGLRLHGWGREERESESESESEGEGEGERTSNAFDPLFAS